MRTTSLRLTAAAALVGLLSTLTTTAQADVRRNADGVSVQSGINLSISNRGNHVQGRNYGTRNYNSTGRNYYSSRRYDGLYGNNYRSRRGNGFGLYLDLGSTSALIEIREHRPDTDNGPVDGRHEAPVIVYALAEPNEMPAEFVSILCSQRNHLAEQWGEALDPHPLRPSALHNSRSGCR